MTDLEQHLEDQADWADEHDDANPATWVGEAKARWTVSNDGLADWALAKLARAEQEITRLRERAEEEHALIEERLAVLLRAPQRDHDFFTWHLDRYYRELTESGRAAGTYRLMNGDLSARKLPDKVVEVDSEAYRDWAEGHARLDLLRITVAPDKRALLAEIKKTGEVPPGIEFVPGALSFRAKPLEKEQPAYLPLPDAEGA